MGLMQDAVSPHRTPRPRSSSLRRRSQPRGHWPFGLALAILFALAGCAQPDAAAGDTDSQRPTLAVDSAVPAAPMAARPPVVRGPRLVSDSSATQPVLEISDGEFVIRLPLAMARLLNDSLPAFTPEPRAGFDTAIVRWVDRPDDPAPSDLATNAEQRLASALSVVVGDFDGDGRRDVAMQGTSGASTAIVMLLAAADSMARPRLIYIDRPRSRGQLGLTGDYLNIVHPGDIEGEDGDPPLHLRTDAIERVFFEKGSQMYFLAHGVMRMLTTSD